MHLLESSSPKPGEKENTHTESGHGLTFLHFRESWIMAIDLYEMEAIKCKRAGEIEPKMIVFIM